jgi:pSer/pThr/pTyr-binding forkhead associated (FHA) protein
MTAAVRPARFQYFIFDNVERKFVKIHDGFVCGRNEGDLQFPSDDVISRKQCRFSIDANDVYVEDLGSTNKTKVNTVPIASKKKRRIQLNDVVEFGRRRFILTNQNKHEPSNFEDVKKKIRIYKAIRKTDGSLTSQISRLITMQTKVLLDRRTYSKLRVREFTQLRGWDLSTALVLVSLLGLWSAATWFFADKGAFAPGLAHSSLALGSKIAIAAIPWTALLTLGHYLAIRKRYKSPIKRIAFVPIWLIVAIISMPLIDVGTSVVSDAAENVVELNCVKRFAADTCRLWASEDSAGFRRLTREQQENILAKLRAEPSAPTGLKEAATPRR